MYINTMKRGKNEHIIQGSLSKVAFKATNLFVCLSTTHIAEIPKWRFFLFSFNGIIFWHLIIHVTFYVRVIFTAKLNMKGCSLPRTRLWEAILQPML